MQSYLVAFLFCNHFRLHPYITFWLTKPLNTCVGEYCTALLSYLFEKKEGFIIDTLYFNNFEDFACAIADSYDSLNGEDYEDVAVVAKYEEARQIIRELLCLGYYIHSINIIDEEYGEYDAEYIISLYDDEVWCEPMLRKNGYITDDSPVIYVLDNCSSKVIPYCKGNIVYEVSVDEYEDEGFEINGNIVSKEEFDEYVSQFKHDEKPTTTSSTSKSTYKINGKEVSKDEFDKKYEEFEEMYLDNIRDMLLGYCNFMDEVNEWRSRMLRW